MNMVSRGHGGADKIVLEKAGLAPSLTQSLTQPMGRRALLGALAGLPLAACQQKAKSSPIAAASPGSAAAPSGPVTGSLEWAVAGPWRSVLDRQQDGGRHPLQTLEFFGLAPGMTVVELWPGGGWWTWILAPYLNVTKGKLYAASFQLPNPDDPAAAKVVEAYRKAIAEKPDIYGDVIVESFGPSTGPLAPPGSADLALAFNLDSWMAAGIAEKAFRDTAQALKPGGVLGLVQARSDPGVPQDPMAANGHVEQAFVKAMAAEAGLILDKASDINDRPANHRPAILANIGGEPDRMTLRFRKKTV